MTMKVAIRGLCVFSYQHESPKGMELNRNFIIWKIIYAMWAKQARMEFYRENEHSVMRMLSNRGHHSRADINSE